MKYEIINTLFCALPVLLAIAFIVLLFVYNKRKKASGTEMSEEQKEKLRTLKRIVTITGIIAAVFISVIIILGGLFFLIMTNM